MFDLTNTIYIYIYDNVLFIVFPGFKQSTQEIIVSHIITDIKHDFDIILMYMKAHTISLTHNFDRRLTLVINHEK